MSLFDDYLGATPSDPVRMRDGVVTAVGDSTVNVNVGGQMVDGVPCARGYLKRTKGDVVLLLNSGGRWVVLDAIGAEADLQIPDSTTVSWGAGAPSGSGWVKEDSGNVWVRANQVYVSKASADPPAPPPPSTPKSVTIFPVDTAAYRDGSIEAGEQNPIQGAWPTYPHPYSGAWFYGTQIADACAGQTVVSMTITMKRAGRGSGGVYGGARVRLYVHNNANLTNHRPDLYGPWSPGSLEPGESDTFAMTSSWRAALASGSARGVGCTAAVGNDYLTYGSCGKIVIKFAS